MTDKQLADLEGKIKTLRFRLHKTDEVIAKNDRQALERQLSSIAGTVTAVNELKEAIEEKKFGKGESEEEVTEWSITVDNELEKADEESAKLRKQLKILDQEEREKEMAQKHETTMKFERELLEQKATFEKHLEQEKTSEQKSATVAKLPKLQITKFDGNVENWLPFWGKFTSEIDKANLPSVTKFGYLKELLERNVRNDIDGLPFTDEGYDNAKAILEAEYGNESDIINAYARNIMELPIISEANPRKVKEFYKNLRFNVQSLETLGRLSDVKGNVRTTLDKLKGIKADLVRGHDEWREWGFGDLLVELKRWVDINPVEEKASPKTASHPRQTARAGKMFYARVEGQPVQTSRRCLYCDTPDHKAINCDEIVNVDERKRILAEKHLCFNCTGSKHRAADCKSKSSCQKCGAKHHTSICNKEQLNKESTVKKEQANKEPGMTANHIGKSTIIHPVVVVRINGLKFRALLDSGASHSYASSTAIALIKATPKSATLRQIAMLTGISTRTMQTFDVIMESVKGDFKLDVNITKIERRELLTLDNPRYQGLLSNHLHLEGMQMDDTDEKEQLPVHLIIGANDFEKIRTGERLRVGNRGDPVAEFTRFGWSVMSPGAETEATRGYLAVNSTVDYEKLCALDVLGLPDNQNGDQGGVYDEFKEQLTRSSEGWYETGLLWKGNCDELLSNREGSQRRLGVLIRKLKRADMLEEYDAIIREQLEDGVVERAPAEVTGKEFYLPHRPVIRENAETTKMRVVYDASAREREGVPSLNECLHTGPSLNNLLWGVITRQRFHPVALTGDLRRAFLQIRVRESERDALRFHWLVDKSSSEVEVLRFTRVVFGLAPSPFLLNGVLQQHLNAMQAKYPASVNEVKRSLYVDDLISGAPTVEEAKQLNNEAVEIFNEATFTLHKWSSNVKELETEDSVNKHEVTYAKEQLGGSPRLEIKLLGLTWEKNTDTLHINFPSDPAIESKRGVLAYLATVYDPLGLVSPVTLEGKRLYRKMCLQKLGWDMPLPVDIAKTWRRWEQGLPKSVSVLRSVHIYQEPIHEIQLHAFGDASGHGVCAAIYAVVSQASGISQGLITTKSRLAKEGLTIPRLELVAGHMAVNLASNVRSALDGFPLASQTHCRLDSTVALHWIQDHGEYKQFVANRVRKIQSHEEARWHHVPTADNPADLGSRGGAVSDKEVWWSGPAWLPYPEQWPPSIVTKSSPDSEAERKFQRELFAVGVGVNNCFDHVLEKLGLRKAMRVCAWVLRFTRNSRYPSKRVKGPLTTTEIDQQEIRLIKHAQKQGEKSSRFVEDERQLNLKLNQYGLWECRGRIQGEFPIYLPDNSLFANKLVKHAHLSTLHGGVSMTMAKVRERFWVPRLRRLAKRVIKGCCGCKRFHAVPIRDPPTGNLPTERTEGATPFNVIGVDFAGPIKYFGKRKTEKKAYVVLYSCCLTHGVFLEVLPSLEADGFIQSLKRLIARRGRPSVVYSDNGTTFVAAAKWLKNVRNDEKFHKFLSDQTIMWRFNVSRAPWWGGHFERLIGLFKSAFYKTVGQGHLFWDELCEVVLDVEVTLNNRPLCYMEEDHQLPTLTPNSLLFLNPNVLPELEPYHLKERNLRKRAKLIQSAKDAMWRRWTGEYMRALRERHQIRHGSRENRIAEGDVVIVKSEERNRNHWPLAIVVELYTGRDGVVRAAKLRKGKGYIERAIQHLYPLELSCDVGPGPSISPEAIVARPRRDAAVAARLRMQAIQENQD